MNEAKSVRVAVVQASATPFDRDAAVDRVCAMTADAAEKGAKLVLLPEAYVGGYPWGLAFGTAVGGRSEAGRRVWERYWSTAIEVPGPEVGRMGEVAEQAGVHLCVGVIERDSTYSGGTLFCTLLIHRPGRLAARQAPQTEADRSRAAHLGRG